MNEELDRRIKVMDEERERIKLDPGGGLWIYKGEFDDGAFFSFLFFFLNLFLWQVWKKRVRVMTLVELQ